MYLKLTEITLIDNKLKLYHNVLANRNWEGEMEALGNTFDVWYYFKSTRAAKIVLKSTSGVNAKIGPMKNELNKLNLLLEDHEPKELEKINKIFLKGQFFFHQRVNGSRGHYTLRLTHEGEGFSFDIPIDFGNGSRVRCIYRSIKGVSEEQKRYEQLWGVSRKTLKHSELMELRELLANNF